MRRKLLPLYVPTDVYRRLEQAGQVEERTAVQQASYILRRALEVQPNLATNHAAEMVA